MKQAAYRRTAAVVGVAVAALLTASCNVGGGGDNTAAPKGSGPVPEPSKPVTISFASWVGNQSGMQKLYRQFHKQHPNITVEFQNIPSEQAQQKLTAQIAGGNPPDTAYVDAGTVAAFASRQALVNLDNYIARGHIVDPNDYVDAFKEFVTYQGSMYGLPFDGESTGLFYRTDLFKAAGISAPPKNWQEFKADAAKLTIPSKKQYGYQVFAPESAYYWYPWLWQAGGQLLSPDGKKVLFDSPVAKRSAAFYVGLTKYSSPDYLNSNSYDGRVAFANGQVAMYMAGAWFAGVMHDEFPKITGKWAAAPLPKGAAGCATTIAGDALVLFAGSEHPDAAWKWIEFLSTKHNMAQWTFKTTGTLLPPRSSLLNSPELLKDKPILKGFAQQMKCGVSNVVANPKWPEIEQALNDELGKAMYGDQSAAQALDNAAAKAKTILAD